MVIKKLACQCKRPGLILGQEDLVRSFLEKEMATQLQNSCLENPTDRRTWWAAIGFHRVAQSCAGCNACVHKMNVRIEGED